MTFRFPRKCPECDMEGIGRKAYWINENTGKKTTTRVCMRCDCEMVKIIG